jgi:abortive infection bacteriophage resistance protein
MRTRRVTHLRSEMDYKKSAITTQEMIDKLQARGLIFNDLDFARMKLGNINYYRLSAFGIPI